MPRRSSPIGVVLAGGKGVRMGGSKLTVELRGRPLISYPVAAMKAALSDVAVIGKPDVELPGLEGVEVWIESSVPRHPLVGIVEALAYADGRSVVVCAADLPFVTPRLIAALARAPADGAPAVIAAAGGDLQPLLGRYEPRAGALLADAAARASAPTRVAVAAIGPRLLEVDDPDELFNVNAPDDLLLASAILDRRGPATRTD